MGFTDEPYDSMGLVQFVKAWAVYYYRRDMISRYDGYEQSLELAAANIAEGEGGLRKRNLGLSPNAGNVVTQRRRDQLKEGIRSVMRASVMTTSHTLSDCIHSKPPRFLCKEEQGF